VVEEDDDHESHSAILLPCGQYMANSLTSSPSGRIVAVVGMGHLDGIERFLGSTGYQIIPCR
jgi:hypothetical protein